MGWRNGQAYSQDLRDRVLGATGSARAVAARFGVSVSYVIKARQRETRSGQRTAGEQRSHTPRLLAHKHAAIAAYVAAHRDATLNEIRAWLREEYGIWPSLGLMWNTLARLGLTLKKRHSTPPSRRGQTSPRPGAAGASCSPG